MAITVTDIEWDDNTGTADLIKSLDMIQATPDPMVPGESLSTLVVWATQIESEIYDRADRGDEIAIAWVDTVNAV